MSSALASRRKGKPCTFTYEFEALEILRTLCPNTQSFGKFLSELLHKEEQRRIEARRLRARFAALVDEDLTT